MTQSNTLTFNNIPLEIIKDGNGLWVRGTQIAESLGYKQPVQRIAQLYTEYADEFSPSMTKMMKVKTSGGIQNTRVFSLRGVHLLAMFAKTPKAKEFRKWVLDVLENHVEGQKPVSSPALEEQLIEKKIIAHEDVTKDLKEAYNTLFPVMDNLRAYKELWETRNILIHSAPRQALALNDALSGLYSALQDDIQSAYILLQDMVTGKKLKAKQNGAISVHHFLERIAKRMK